MGQYRTGSVTLFSGEAVVTGQGTAFLSNVAAGNLFKKIGESALYEVGSVDSDGQITLTSKYVGSGESGVSYAITKDFTPNFSLPEIGAGDRDWSYTLTRALRLIDTELYTKDFDFRCTCAWSASSAAKDIVGGVGQDVLTSKHFITSIVSRVILSTDVENIEIGDGDDANYYVTAIAPTTTPIIHTLVKNLNDATHLKVTATPAAEATMIIEFIVRGFLLDT